MKRVQGLVAVSGMWLGLSAALAAPPVVDRVPDNALITLVVPSPQELHKHATALIAATEAPLPMQLPTVEDALTMAGITKGIDLTKSFAVVIMGPKELDKPAGEPKADGEKPKEGAKPGKKPRKKAVAGDEIDWEAGMDRSVMVVPITKYEDLLANFDVKPAGEGKVDTFVSPEGDDAFAKDIGGGYAVIGPEKALVEAFTGKSGAASIKSRLGKAGDAVADASDFVVIINMDRVRPEAQKGLVRMQKQLREQMEAVGQGGQEKNLAVMQWLGETVVRDTQLLVAGLKVGSLGVTADLVGSFKPDSYLAKSFAGKGDASALLNRLPAGPFLLAGAMDMSGAGLKTLFKDLTAKVDMPGGPEAAKAAAANIDVIDGQAAVVGIPLTAFSGLFTSTVLFNASKNPDAALKGFKDSMTAMNGQKVGEIVYSTTYVENASKAGDVPLAAWETKIKSESDDQPAPLQQLAFLFGPQGAPVGYVAKAPDGIYVTYARNTDLMAKALGAAKGENLSADSMIRQTAEMLPKGRSGELYIGVKGVMDLVLPFAAMGGFTVPADKIPEKLPPIAASLSSQDGAVRLSLVIPAPVLKTGFSLGQAFMDAKDGGGGEDGGKAKPEKGAGQPKF